MAKYINATLLDRSLELLQASANRVTICSAQPTTYAEAMTTYALGTLAASSGNFTIANGDTSGRKITYAAATVTVGTSGNVTHVALCGTAGSGTLLLVGTCATQAVTAAGSVIISAVDVWEIGTIT